MKAAEDFVTVFATHKGVETRRFPTRDWRDGLIITEKTKAPKGNVANVLHALREADAWDGVLAFDTFTMKTMVTMPPPWADFAEPWTPRPWNGHDDVSATEWLQRAGIGASLDVVASVIGNAARETETHAVRDYLDGLVWDSKPRLDRWLHTYLGADNTRLMTTFSRCFLVGAIARVMKPGAKVDTMLVLEGPQGAGKSQALAILGGPFFTDEIADLGSKDAAEGLAGKWIVELSELDAMSRSEATRTKAFLSRSVDHYRPPYGRATIDVPRQCVFAGTTNNDAWQKDETGGRRFWPVRVGALDLAALRRDRDQLWAEAAHAYAQKAKWWIEDHAVLAEAEEEQAARSTSDPWDELVQRFVEYRSTVTVSEIMTDVLAIEIGRRDKASEMRVSRILKLLGFQRHQQRTAGARSWAYRRE